MATLVSKPNWGRLIVQGIAGGIVGGILIDVFQVLAMHIPIVQLWQWVASAAFGQAAYSSTNYLWYGLLFHAGVSIGWAIGYAYVAATRPYVLTTPWLSGLVFGAVVWLAMEIVLTFDRMAGPITTTTVAMGLIACCIFYGIPVALIVCAVAKRA